MNTQLTHDLLLDRAEIDGQHDGLRDWRSGQRAIIRVPLEYLGTDAALKYLDAYRAAFKSESENSMREMLNRAQHDSLGTSRYIGVSNVRHYWRVKGGQGRSASETEQSARVFGWICLVCAAILALAYFWR